MNVYNFLETEDYMTTEANSESFQNNSGTENDLFKKKKPPNEELMVAEKNKLTKKQSKTSALLSNLNIFKKGKNPNVVTTKKIVDSDLDSDSNPDRSKDKFEATSEVHLNVSDSNNTKVKKDVSSSDEQHSSDNIDSDLDQSKTDLFQSAFQKPKAQPQEEESSIKDDSLNISKNSSRSTIHTEESLQDNSEFLKDISF